MNLMARVEAVKQTWHLLLPTCPIPDDTQIARWAVRFGDAELEFAFTRTASKWRRGLQSDATSAHRFCTSVLVNERREAGGQS
jgi:hypothetical protein